MAGRAFKNSLLTCSAGVEENVIFLTSIGSVSSEGSLVFSETGS